MKKFLLLVCMIACCVAAFAQSVTLTFTAKDAANQHVQLNYVSITNLTKGWQETIYWPDTTLTMQNGIGIADVETRRGTSLQLSQNNPNPFTGTTEVSLMVAEEDEVMLDIVDVNGKIVGTYRMRPQVGTHQFRITLSTAGTYVMTARQNGQTSSIKMVCNGGGDGNRIEYTGVVETHGRASLPSSQPKNGPKYTTTRPFNFGDQMEYVGYATINGTEAESNHVSQIQNASQSFVLQFDVSQAQDGQPCPGAATVTDIDGNTYNTVQIGNQCWMKENLRTTRYANGSTIPLGTITSSTTSYRYNPNNDASIVPTYGYLYNWPAVMHGASSSSANPSGMQGICPNGWHVPSDAELTQLTSYVGSRTQYQCNNISNNIAKALASTTGWDSSTNTCAVGDNSSTNNATGFSALPAGNCSDSYDNFGYYASFWSATESGEDRAYRYYLFCNYANVFRSNVYKFYGFSVRCVRDATDSVSIPTVFTNTVSNISSTSAICGGNVTLDGGAVVTSRGVCWSTLQNPTVSGNHTSNGSGTGSFTSGIIGLAAGTTYYVRAYATNSAGTAYGSQVSFTTTSSSTGQDGQPCPGAATVMDIDNNTYNTVLIGNQCWMKENLRTTRYANGSTISLGTITSSTMSYRYNPNNDASIVSTYGYLYNWPAVMHGASSSASNPSGVQGICPTGWHVPSDAEWTQLTSYVGSQTQYQCNNSSSNIAKALAFTTEWDSSTNTCAVGNNPSMNNATGFSALPAGNCSDSYDNFGYYANFWSATESSEDRAYRYYLSYDYANVLRYNFYKFYGFSVRCVRD